MKKYFIIILMLLGFGSYSYCNSESEYVIKEGDSLWSILSNKYNLTSPIELNKIIGLCLEKNPSIKNPDILWVGEKILIPEDSEFGKAAVVDNESLQNILNKAENRTPEEIDKLFLDMQDYQLVENFLLVMVFGRYELKIKADRLLIPRNITAENKQEYLINYITSPAEKTSTNLENLLKEKNYTLIEIIVK